MLRCVLVAALAASTSLALRKKARHARANLGEATLQPASVSWGLDRIGAGPRRSQAQGRGIHIFVVDGGVRTTHQDFGGRAMPAVDFTIGAWNNTLPKECHGDTSCAVDLNGLGTFAAGLAAGTVHGVAPQALVHAVKVVKSEGSIASNSRLVAVLNWIVAAGVRPAVAAITLNAGVYGMDGCEESALQEAADAAIAAGVTIVNSAGENRRAEDACRAGPSCGLSVITVGATFLNAGYDVKWPRGNIGQCVDLWAPGPGVRSITNTNDAASATSQEAFKAAGHGSDGFERGGSAAAHVAGAAALVLERNPDLQAPQVKQRLLSDASVDYIHGLGSDDHNRMLYVGEDAPLPRGNENPVDEASHVASPAEAMASEHASERLPATGLPCGGTGLSVGTYKVDGGLMTMKGQMADETFQLYFNVTSIQDKDDGSLECSSMRWSFDDTRSIIAGAPVRNWVAWRYHRRYDKAASPLTFTANLLENDYDYHDGEPFYYSQTEDVGNLQLKRFELCNVDSVCYYQVFVSFNQGKIRLSQLRDPDEPWSRWKRWFQTRNPLQKVS